MSDSPTVPATPPKRIGVAADHGGFESKEDLAGMLREADYDVVDFGDSQPKPDDDYPDFVVPLARAVSRGEVDRGCAKVSTAFDETRMRVSPYEGTPAEASMLLNVPRLVTAYYTKQPYPSVPEERVAFGASGHRGSSFDKAFNERHILAISKAICLYREHKKAPDRSDKS